MKVEIELTEKQAEEIIRKERIKIINNMIKKLNELKTNNPPSETKDIDKKQLPTGFVEELNNKLKENSDLSPKQIEVKEKMDEVLDVIREYPEGLEPKEIKDKLGLTESYERNRIHYYINKLELEGLIEPVTKKSSNVEYTVWKIKGDRD